MHIANAMSNTLDVRRAVDCLRWITVLKLTGAGFVALGVVCELIGEFAGSSSEETIERAQKTEIAILAQRLDDMTLSLQRPREVGLSVADPGPVPDGGAPVDGTREGHLCRRSSRS